MKSIYLALTCGLSVIHHSDDTQTCPGLNIDFYQFCHPEIYSSSYMLHCIVHY